MDYRQLAYQTAQKYGIDPDLFVRQIQAESAFRPDAVSSAGAIGLGQLMPATAKELGVDPTDPVQNLEGAARYMKQQLDRFGDPALALAAYNAGPSRVAKANGVPNITETQNYVAKILGGKGGAAMAQEPQQPQGLLGGLLGGQGIGERLGLSPEFSDKLAMAVMAGTGDPRLTPLIEQRAASMKERRAEAKLEKGINKTVEWLKSKNREDLVGAVMTGVIDPASAIQAALAKPKEKTYQYQSLVKDLMAANPNLSYKDALDMALSQTKSGTTVNVGPTGIDYGKPPNNMAWRRDSAGNVMTDERGAPIAVPISGTELAEKLSAAEKAEEKAASAKEVAQTTVSRGVKDALAIMESKGLSDILPEAGAIGKFLADYTWNQEARDLRRTLQSLQANTAFTRLQEMRDASKTGGALGNVSNVELELLMSSYGSLSQDLSPDRLRTNLKNIEKVMGKIEEDPVARAFYEDGVDLRGSEVDAQVKAGNGSNTVIEYDAQGNRVSK
jgi:hypothetical protein